MPRGKPKKPMGLRLDPALVAEVRALTDNLAVAIEDGLRFWVRREKAKRARQDHLTRS